MKQNLPCAWLKGPGWTHISYKGRHIRLRSAGLPALPDVGSAEPAMRRPTCRVVQVAYRVPTAGRAIKKAESQTALCFFNRRGLFPLYFVKPLGHTYSMPSGFSSSKAKIPPPLLSYVLCRCGGRGPVGALCERPPVNPSGPWPGRGQGCRQRRRECRRSARGSSFCTKSLPGNPRASSRP